MACRKGGAVGQASQYFSPSEEEFARQCEVTGKVAEENGGNVKLHFNFAFSWDVEVLSGPNVGQMFRVNRQGQIALE